MSPIMTFRIAFKALSRNKMRTSLTMLGMIIGVAAVITLVALGNGAQSVVEDQIKAGGTNLFGEDGDGTGQTIRIRNQPFRVIGVMAPKGATMNEDLDDQILAPYTTVQKRLTGQTNIQTITVSAASGDTVNEVADRIAIT